MELFGADVNLQPDIGGQNHQANMRVEVAKDVLDDTIRNLQMRNFQLQLFQLEQDVRAGMMNGLSSLDSADAFGVGSENQDHMETEKFQNGHARVLPNFAAQPTTGDASLSPLDAGSDEPARKRQRTSLTSESTDPSNGLLHNGLNLGAGEATPEADTVAVERASGQSPPPKSAPPATRAWILHASASASGGGERGSQKQLRSSPPASVASKSTLAAEADRLPYPEWKAFPGMFDVHVDLPEDEVLSGKNISRSAHWTHDSASRTLYVKPAKPCPFRINIGKDLPDGAFLHVMCAFAEPEHFSEPVVRCANHREMYSSTGLGRHDQHFVLSENPTARHLNDVHGRPYILIPYSRKREGVHTESFQFTCFSSSCTPFKKKTLKMGICIVHNGSIHARDVLHLRVCACPGRDRATASSKQLLAVEGDRRKRPRTESSPSDEEYTIRRTVHGYKNFVLITKMIDILESQYRESLTNQPSCESPNRSHGSPASSMGSDQAVSD